MTVSTTASRAEYTGNGSTVAFAVVDTGGASAVIPVLDATHLQVYVDGTLKTKDTHYTVSIVTATAAATVTFITSPTDYTPASSTSIVILRVIPYTQLQDYVNNDAFDAENVESALDQLTQALHQIVDDKDRSIKFSSTIASSDFNTDEETASKITSVKADRASKYLSFDADGDITTSITVDGVSYTETSIATGDILVYNGSAFVNTKLLPRITQILDSSGNEVIKFGTTGSAVNEITVTNAATGNPPTISATGEADKGIDFENSEGEELLKLASVSSAVNEVKISNAATGDNPTISATGEADTGITFENSESEEILILDATATAVNEFTIANSATGNAPTLSTTGDDDNIDIIIDPKGTGEVVIGTGSASGKITTNSTQDLVLDTNAGTNSGTITITDGADGNIDITPNGTGEVNISKVDIDSGTIDGTDVTVGAGKTLDVSAGTLTTSTTQKQAISATAFESGTKMLFQQTSAPTGWTKVTGSGNDTALRVTTGTVGTGGSVAFETAFASHTPTITMSNAAHTLTTAQLPSHSHPFGGWSSGTVNPTLNSNVMIANIFGNETGGWSVANAGGGGAVGSGSSHTHNNTATSSAINLDVSYVDVIIATKD